MRSKQIIPELIGYYFTLYKSGTRDGLQEIPVDISQKFEC